MTMGSVMGSATGSVIHHFIHRSRWLMGSVCLLVHCWAGVGRQVRADWKEVALSVMQGYTVRTTGTFVEEEKVRGDREGGHSGGLKGLDPRVGGGEMAP